MRNRGESYLIDSLCACAGYFTLEEMKSRKAIGPPENSGI